MRRTFTFLSLTVLIFIGSSSYVVKTSTGIAGQTGAPGEATCAAAGCHSGGSSTSKGVTLTTVPSFTANQYMADSTYQINIQVAATGFNRFGFDCEILDSLNQDAGLMTTAGAGVKFLFAVGKKNATHTGPKLGTNGTTFTFTWTAPSEGRVNFYACANAVNLNGNTTGDLPIPFFDFFYPAPLPVDTTIVNGIAEQKEAVSGVHFYPNPVEDYSTISYDVTKPSTVGIDLINLQGATVKHFATEKQTIGSYSKILDFQGVASGVYFIRTTANGKKTAQKLVTVN